MLPLRFHVSRLTKPAIWADDNGRREMTMGLLWLLVILLIIFAIFGGVAVNSWLWLLLIIVLVLVLVGYA
jgi:uncharacterized membrane protein